MSQRGRKADESAPARSSGMVRETFKHAAIYGGANTLGQIVGFLMLPFYSHILRGFGYGVIGIIDAALTLLSSLLAYNFQGAITRIYHEEPDGSRKLNVASTGTALAGLLVLPIVGIGMLLSVPISRLLFGTAEYWVIVVLALGSFLTGMVSSTAKIILVIERRSATYSLLAIISLLTSVTLNIIIIVILKWGIVGYFIANLLSSVIHCAISLSVLARHCPLHWNRDIAGRLLKYQLPLIPGAIANFFSRQIERVVLRYQADLSTLGVLEMGYKFPVLINLLLIGPFMQSWNTKSLEIADQPGGKRRISEMFIYFLYIALLGFLLLAVNVRTVLQIMTPPEFWEAYRVAIIEAAQTVAMGVAAYAGFGLLYAKRTDLFARILIVTSVIKVGLSYFMIVKWGLYGAAWSGFFSAVAIAIWRAILSQRFYRLEIDWRKAGLIVAVAGGLSFGIARISTESIAAWGAPALDLLQRAAAGMQDTWLGTWKGGKVLTILTERSSLVLALVVRTVMAASYLLILPVVHIESQRKIMRKLESRGLRSRRP